jgi:glycosyltransferase involved in cell wall biosynthesis
MKFIFIIVCYNDYDNLKISLNKMEEYLSNNINILVIDGKSTDNTIDFLKNYKLLYPNNFDYVSDFDKGIYDAMNKGWNMCDSNDFICFLGAGDYVLTFPSSSFFKSYDAFYGNVMLGSSFFKINTNKFKNLFVGNYIHHQGLILKKNTYYSPFDIRFPTYADYNFNLKLLNDDVYFHFLNDFSVYVDPNGISSRFNFFEMSSIIFNNVGFHGLILFIFFFFIKIIYKFICRFFYLFLFLL